MKTLQFGTKLNRNIDEVLNRMVAQDRKRQIALMIDDNEIEEPEHQLYVDHATHPRSVWMTLRHYLIQFLP